jgi:hypothetical protein
MGKSTRRNKVLESSNASINAHTSNIPLQMQLAKASGAVRGTQAKNILGIYRQFALGGSTLTDAGTVTPDNDGFYQYLNAPSTVRGIKKADREEFLVGVGSSLASELYTNWCDSAMDSVAGHGPKAMVSALNIVEQQRRPFQRMVYIFLKGNSKQVERLVGELASRDSKATLSRLRELLESINNEIAYDPNQEGGHYKETKNGKELTFQFSMTQVTDRTNAIAVATKKYEEAIADDQKALDQMTRVLDKRQQSRLDGILPDGRTTETKTETRVKNDLAQEDVNNAVNALDNIIEDVKVVTVFE